MEGIVQHIYNDEAASFTFTADNTVNEVPIVSGGPVELKGGNLFYLFQQGAGVLIEGINLVVPYQYGQATIEPILINLTWENEDASENGPLDSFGQNGNLWIPEPNNYIELMNYVKYPALDKRWTILADIFGNINQINGPDSLQDEVLDIKLFLKIRTSYSLEVL